MDTWRQWSPTPDYPDAGFMLTISGPDESAASGSELEQRQRELISAFRGHIASHPRGPSTRHREPELCAAEVESRLCIHQPEVVDELIERGVSREAVMAVLMVPMLVVAWSDRRLSRHDRTMVLGAALSIVDHIGSPSLAPLGRWLERRPSRALRDAWGDYVEQLARRLPGESGESFRANLLAWPSGLVRRRRSILGRVSLRLRRAVHALRGLERTLLRVG